MFDLNPSNASPIYRQIVDQVRRTIAGGELLPGFQMPSVRTVAIEHAINPMTVSKAYSLLEAEGLLIRQRGMGMVVADQPAFTSHEQRLDLLSPHLDAAARIAAQLKVSPSAALKLFALKLKAIDQDSKLTIENKEKP